jgi:hypothetical protein
MSVISKERVETKQADNMAVVRELIRREGAPAIGLGNYSAELDRLRQAFAGLTKDILFMAAAGVTGTGQVGRGVPLYKRGNGNAPAGTDLEPAATGGEQRLSGGDH